MIMTTDSLIGKLQQQIHTGLVSSNAWGHGHNAGIEVAIELIRQHQAAPSQEVVERVAQIIQHHDDNYGGAWFEQRETVKNDFRQTAKAAIAAMQAAVKDIICDHQWGIDGQHSNEYCKKCFINKVEGCVNRETDAYAAGCKAFTECTGNEEGKFLAGLRAYESAKTPDKTDEWNPQYDWPRSGLDIVRNVLSQNNVYFQGKNGDVYRVWLELDTPLIECVQHNAPLPQPK